MESELEKIAYIYGDVCIRRRRQRRKRQKLLISELLFDYAKNSTLHGLRYIVSRGLSIIEKLFWFITFTISIVLCSYCIYTLYIKWQTSPVIVAMNGRPTSSGTIPFPAVTICPQIKVKEDVYNYTEVTNKIRDSESDVSDVGNGNTDNFSDDDFKKYLHIRPMCDDNTMFAHENVGIDFTDKSLIDDLTEVAPTINDIFQCCTWQAFGNYTCEDLFSRVYTEEGVCYTMNTMAAADLFENSVQSNYPYLLSNTSLKGWSENTGYDYSVKDPFPKRGRVLGSLPDLQLLMKNNPEQKDEKCNGLLTGFKVYLHHPTDFPQSSLHYYAALPNKLASMAINFHQFQTDPELNKYPFQTRQCYFSPERKLRYFKLYTEKNCQAECLSNYTYKYCGCVGFFMPHDNSSQLCSNDKQDCMIDAKDRMAHEELFNVDIGFDSCNCLSACNAIEYDAEVTTTEYYLKDVVENLINSDKSYAKIDLFFKKPQFVAIQRRELFGTLDFLANIGGLMSVFIGFSFLSLVEIFYFFTMRIGFTLKRDLEKEKAKKTHTSNGAVVKKHNQY